MTAPEYFNRNPFIIRQMPTRRFFVIVFWRSNSGVREVDFNEGPLQANSDDEFDYKTKPALSTLAV